MLRFPTLSAFENNTMASEFLMGFIIYTHIPLRFIYAEMPMYFGLVAFGGGIKGAE